jgi:hypothetical protein
VQQYDLFEIKKEEHQYLQVKNFEIEDKCPNRERKSLQKNNRKNKNAISASEDYE